ncbi:MAG: TonB-dependent receptor [Pseudomonadota bacterium]
MAYVRFEKGLRRASPLPLAFVASALAAGAAATNAGAETATSAPAPPIDEIIVSGGRLAGAKAAAAVFALDEQAIAAIRPAGLDDVLRNVPSATVQTNSRGESLVFLRGAGERQTAVFFAGAPLNVPWDNRLNLGLIPPRALSDVHVTPGPASVLFGANTAGGVIELSPASFTLDHRAAFDLQGGQGGLFEAAGLAAARKGPSEIVLAGGHLTRDGQPLSGDAGLPFFQTDEDLRTNTDLRRTNGLARIAFDQGGPLRASATFLAVDSVFGIAPEGRADAGGPNPRFWRYPDHRTLMGVLNVGYHDDAGFDMASAFWVQHFNQRIDSFATEAYADLEDAQTDRDRSYGFRTVATKAVGEHAFRGAFSLSDARHRQTDETFSNSVLTQSETSFFRQRTFSFGAEYERAIGDVTLMAGGGLDATQALDAGGRPADGGFAAWSLVGAADWRATDKWSFGLAAARKPRLPTQRELFGEAIGRFLLNPDLQPEIATQIELSARYASSRAHLAITPFANVTSNTIDQETVTVDGIARRRRINLDGARGIGVDIVGGVDVTDRLSISGNVSLLNLRRRGARPGEPRILTERPSLLGLIAADYRDPTGLGLRIEARQRGRAYAPVDDGFEPLPRSTEINLEASYTAPLKGVSSLELFVRADNVNDALVEPQFGLPAPGRWVRGGVRMAFE